MRAILWLTVAASVLYGSYWVVGSRSVLQGTQTALADMKAQGLADYTSVTIRGFPSRFDLRVEAPALTSSDHRIHWAADYLQIYALSYRPNHIIAVWPPTQSLKIGPETLAITTDDARASAVFGIGTSLPLDHAQMVVKNLGVNSDFDWGLTLDEARLAIRLGQVVTDQEIGVELFGLTLTGLPGAPMAATGPTAKQSGHARLDAVLHLDGPLDRFVTERGLRALGVEFRAIELDWGRTRITGDGAIIIDASGQPDGTLNLHASNWRDALAVFVELGMVRAELAPTILNMLNETAKASGDPEVLDMPLVFGKGQMRLGPFPLGPSPSF